MCRGERNDKTSIREQRLKILLQRLRMTNGLSHVIFCVGVETERQRTGREKNVGYYKERCTANVDKRTNVDYS